MERLTNQNVVVWIHIFTEFDEISKLRLKFSICQKFYIFGSTALLCNFTGWKVKNNWLNEQNEQFIAY